MALARGLRNAPIPGSASRVSTGLRRGREGPYLGDAQRPPFLLPQELERAPRTVEVIFGDDLQHLLGELHVAILVFVV